MQRHLVHFLRFQCPKYIRWKCFMILFPHNSKKKLFDYHHVGVHTIWCSFQKQQSARNNIQIKHLNFNLMWHISFRTWIQMRFKRIHSKTSRVVITTRANCNRNEFTMKIRYAIHTSCIAYTHYCVCECVFIILCDETNTPKIQLSWKFSWFHPMHYTFARSLVISIHLNLHVICMFSLCK